MWLSSNCSSEPAEEGHRLQKRSLIVNNTGRVAGSIDQALLEQIVQASEQDETECRRLLKILKF
jgi:hypothetical protein